MTNQRQLFALLAVLGAHSGVTLKFHYHHLTAERISLVVAIKHTERVEEKQHYFCFVAAVKCRTVHLN